MADTGKIALASLLFLSLILQAGFCSWNQSLIVSVEGQNGVPVSGADVKITYQKANGITGGDGLAEGITGEDGKYSVTIANTVPDGMDDTRIRVVASAYGWTSGAQTVQAEGGNGTKNVSFAAPFTLVKMAVTVLQANGMPAPGASIYITGSEVKTVADNYGKAVLYLPEGAEISGFASYEDEGDYFSSSAATVAEDGSRELVVKFSSGEAGASARNSSVLTVKFISVDGAALSGEKVVFSHDGTGTSAYTDAGGMVSVEVDGSGEVIASVNKNDYNYSFAFNVTADGSPKNETAALTHLLRIEYFESKPDGAGCYAVSAKASDPRLNKPISIRMMQVKNDSTPAGEIRVALDENDVYTGKVCAGADMQARVVASNGYETVEKTIPLSQAAAQEPPKPANTTQQNASQIVLPKPIEETSPIDGLGAILVGIAILVLISGAAVLMLGRVNPQATGGMAKYFAHTWGILAESTVRPIMEYLHSLTRKKEPPRTPFGQGPMMPQG